MADNNTKIIITAEDKASAALGSISKHVGGLQSALGSLGGTLAGTLTIGGMAALIKNSIDAADAMNDLSQRVGVNVKQLAGYELAARQSGTSMEALAKGIKGLAVNMVEHAGALKAAGITARDADGAMMQLADLFAAMPDGIEKTTLAVKVFGKSGMELIPMLNLGAQGLAEAQEKSRLYAERLAELAPKADQFNDQMAELGLQAKAAGLNITTYFMPGLIGMSTWLNDIAAGGEKARGAMAWLADITNSEILSALATIMPREQGYKGPKDALGLPAPSATPMLPGENSPAEAAAIARARKLREALGGEGKGGAGTDTALARMLALGQKNLYAAQDSEEEMRLLAEKRAAQDAARAYKDLTDMVEAANKAQAAHADALGKDLAAAERALETYGMTEAQIAALTLARVMHARAMEAEQDADEATLARYDAEIDALERIRTAKYAIEARDAARKEAEEAARAWENFSRDIESSLTDALMRGFEAGNGFGENFVKTLKRTLETAALKVAVQAVVNPIMGAAQSALGGGSGGGLSLPGLPGGGGLYGSFATSGVGQSLGLSAASDFTGALTLTESGMAVGSALPWVGGALALASMGGLFEGDGDAQRTGRFFAPFAGSNAPGSPMDVNLPDGSRYNWLNNSWFSADMQPELDKFDAELQATEQSIIDKLGLSAAQVAAINDQLLNVQGEKRYGFGMEHTSVAASGVFGQIEADRLQTIAGTLGMSLKDLQDQMSGATKTAKELAAEAKALSEAAKQASANRALAGIGATLSSIDAVTGLRSGLLASIAGLQGGNTYASRMGGLQALLAGETDVSRQVDLAGQIKDLVLERYQAERAAIERNQAAATQAAEALRAGLRSVGDYARGLLVGNLSPLTNAQRLAEAGSQYMTTLGRARGGDLSAIGSLSGAAGTYLEQARGYYASSASYGSIFSDVQGALAAMGLSADSVMDAADWQAQMLAVDNEALGSLGQLTRFTEDWTTNLETLLVGQTREFEKLGVKLADVAENTKALDSRIAVLLDTALAVRFDKLAAAVDKSAQTTARAVTNLAQVVVRS